MVGCPLPPQEVHDRARALAATLGMPWAQTSAHSGAGVARAFKSIIDGVQEALSRQAAQEHQPMMLAVQRGSDGSSPKAPATRQVVVPTPRSVQQASALAGCPRIFYLCNNCRQPSFEHEPPAMVAKVQSRQELAAATLQVFDDDDDMDDCSLPAGGPNSESSLDQENIGAAASARPCAPACAEQHRI